MKIIRFKYKNKENWGIIEDNNITILEQAPFDEIIPSKKNIPFKNVQLLPPSNPSKIILVGLNYKDHAAEMNEEIPDEPIIFIKPPTTIIAHNEDIIYPEIAGRVDYEAELALIIKREAKNILQNKANDYILGYTCLNDVTARDLQAKDKQWTRAKSFDTFCPVGPCIETNLDPSNLTVKSCLNGLERQHSSTGNFIFSVEYLISFISNIMTLLPGDIISTGTPPGIGEMHPGDIIEIKIEGIGTLKNRVI